MLEWTDILFTPLSLSLGRDTLQYDNGLFFCAQDSEWLFDHIELGYDIPSFNVSAMYGSVSQPSPENPFKDFAFLHGHHDRQSSVFASASAYSGVFSMDNDGLPLIAGLYVDIIGTRKWNMFFETAGETGSRPGDKSLLAGIIDTGLSYQRGEKTTKTPDTLGIRWTFAGGDSAPDGQHTFIPLFNYEQWGHVFSPNLSNIHIISLTGSLALTENLHIALSGFSYFQAHANESSASSGHFRNGGYIRETNGKNRELGSEIDGSIQYKLPLECLLEIQGGYFMQGSAYSDCPEAGNASEILVQLSMEF